ncbi:IPT/TIG domain-containing protein [Anthocerotibacter panamensis]|uniref:IPT/TIG domain-containing protein n=1 Tax=Anthocerotibacter panamensis TaxID=2857077 RepID=UPI001C40718A|nr:IPT/TIG domain-containing protein [Anthocerotibacter panamensis]
MQNHIPSFEQHCRRFRSVWCAVGLSLSALVSLTSIAAAAPTPPAAPQASLKPITMRAARFDVSRPLRELTPRFLPRGKGEEREVPNEPLVELNELNERQIKRLGRILPRPDAVLQKFLPPNATIPTPITNFDGVSNDDNNTLFGFRVAPPDINGDVGPNHYFQWVNLAFRIFDKAGNLVLGPRAGSSLWSGFGGLCETTNQGDPVVLYDPLADRWMVTQFAFTSSTAPPFFQCIAVSTTPDPTGTYYRYAYDYGAASAATTGGTALFNDYGKFGVWPDGYYMTANQFGPSGFAGGGVVAFEREKMLLGLPAQAVYFNLGTVNPGFGGILPSDVDGAAPPLGTPNYFFEVDDDNFGIDSNPVDRLSMWEFHVDWANTSNSTFGLNGQPNVLFISSLANPATFVRPDPATVVANTLAEFNANLCNFSRNCIPQLNTTRGLDAIADRVLFRAAYRNFGTYQSLVLSHTVNATGTDTSSTGTAGVRWYELRNTGSGLGIFQQGTFAPDTVNRWMGSIAQDGSGNIAAGYSASNASIFPQIRYSGRVPSDPPGTFGQGEATLFAGNSNQTSTSSRWGDYSMMTLDPLDNCTFWFTSEYAATGQTSTTAPWRTRIGSFRFPGCSPAPQAVSFSTPSGPVGSSVTISGASFDPAPGNTTVLFRTATGGVAAPITSITPSTIAVTVPAGAVTGRLQIRTPLGRTNTPNRFVVTR